MKIDIPILEHVMALVKHNAPKPTASWEEIAKFTVILLIKILGAFLFFVGFAWVITYF